MMRLVWLLLLLLLMAVLVLQQLWSLVLLLGIYITYRFGAAGLVLVAIGTDAYLGAFTSVPYLSLGAVLWYVISELVRLRLRIIE